MNATPAAVPDAQQSLLLRFPAGIGGLISACAGMEGMTPQDYILRATLAALECDADFLREKALATVGAAKGDA